MIDFEILKESEHIREKNIENIYRLQRDGYAVIMYGKGTFAEEIEKYLNKRGVAIYDSFVDVEYKTSRDNDLGDIIGKYPGFCVVMGVTYPGPRAAMRQKINAYNMGIPIFEIGDTYPAGMPYLHWDIINRNRERIDRVFAETDQLSCSIVEAFLMSKLSGDYGYLQKIDARGVSGTEYFNEVFGRIQDEIFVDGGAYDGDTYEQFLNSGKATFKKYYAFEPDEKNIEKLKTKCRNDSRCIPIQKCLGMENGVIHFEMGMETASHVSNDSSHVVEVTDIDTCCGDATFIKLDIEGSETDALRGAKGTIRKNHPKLAVCCYHRADDIWRIPEVIKNIDESYSFCFRMHQNDVGRDLVLYAY